MQLKKRCKVTQIILRARAHFREKCGKIDTLTELVALKCCKLLNFGK